MKIKKVLKKIIVKPIVEKVEPENPESMAKTSVWQGKKIVQVVGGQEGTSIMVEVVLENGTTTMVPRKML